MARASHALHCQHITAAVADALDGGARSISRTTDAANRLRTAVTEARGR